MKKIAFISICLGALLAANAFAAPVLNTTDFLNSGNRTNFNGFESIGNDGTFFTGGSGPYTRNNIRVQQINGDPGNDIWVTLGNMTGNYSWYPNGGDNGYTQITLADGSDFWAFEFMYRSYNMGNLRYILLNDGNVVADGFVAATSGALGRFGFEQGGFDTILVRSGTFGSDFYSGELNALQIDNIEVVVPEPASLALLGAALAGLGLARRRTAA